MAEFLNPVLTHPRVGFFVTCLVNVMRPAVARSAIELLEQAGCRVEVPLDQTCCGQPAFNSGDRAGGVKMARHLIEGFEGFDYVVAPSGSCAGTIVHAYLEALADDPVWLPRAKNLAAKTHEVMSFLVDVMRFRPAGIRFETSVTYHDTCSGLREMNVFAQPRTLLKAMRGVDFRPLPGNDVCCGFGGTFCVKYPSISNAIVDEKAAAIESTGAKILLGGDLGCLMNIAGKLKRRGSSVRTFHAVEVIAGHGNAPAIGEEV